MMQNSKSIGNKIASARKKNNFSQAGLAEKVSISPQAVGKWERGESLPDITTLSRLAEILGVDLNYFSDNFIQEETPVKDLVEFNLGKEEAQSPKERKTFDWNWDMSQGNWIDSDFSGLKNLKDKFSSSNIKNCKFIHSDLSGLTLGKNNIELCDFSSSDISRSKLESSNILNDTFNDCSFIDAEFLKNNIGKCSFLRANFSGAEFKDLNFENNKVENAIWKFTSFKNSAIGEITFEGTIEDCHFENCSFHKVKFQNATLINTFFKYNRRFKKVEFINCSVDKMTYAFLKNNDANLSDVKILE